VVPHLCLESSFSSCVHTRRHSLFKVREKLPLLVLRLVGLLLADLSPALQMKQSMQGTAATTDQSNVVKDSGAKYDELFRKLGHSGMSFRENVSSFSSKFLVSISMPV